jgi:glycosyltransferase involved in cell wall biosynthesis
VRLLVYTDYVYRRRDGAVFGERAFVLFLAALADEVDEVTLLGRLAPDDGPARYRVPPAIRFVALPYYERLAQPLAVLGSAPRTLARAWRALGDADVVWLLGPHPHGIALAVLARVRRRRLVLGVRQDLPAYVRNRHPGRRRLHFAASALEACWRGLARRAPVVAVGTDLARRYGAAPSVLATTVSLVTAGDVRAGERVRRDYAGPLLQLLSVGRLDAEKNPLLLADTLALLRTRDPRWRLVVCGEGDLADALRDHLRVLGLAAHSDVRGYVPLRDGLLDLYRTSHVFLHSSFTEGLPQVLIEAHASGLPVVATAVGGVTAFGDSALLVPPADSGAAAAAVNRLLDDEGLRERLTAAGLAFAAECTLEAKAREVARFIADPTSSPRGRESA